MSTGRVVSRIKQKLPKLIRILVTDLNQEDEHLNIFNNLNPGKKYPPTDIHFLTLPVSHFAEENFRFEHRYPIEVKQTTHIQDYTYNAEIVALCPHTEEEFDALCSKAKASMDILNESNKGKLSTNKGPLVCFILTPSLKIAIESKLRKLNENIPIILTSLLDKKVIERDIQKKLLFEDLYSHYTNYMKKGVYITQINASAPVIPMLSSNPLKIVSKEEPKTFVSFKSA